MPEQNKVQDLRNYVKNGKLSFKGITEKTKLSVEVILSSAQTSEVILLCLESEDPDDEFFEKL